MKGNMGYKLENPFDAEDIDFSKWNYPKVRVGIWSSFGGYPGQKIGSFVVQVDDSQEPNYFWLKIKSYDIYEGDDQKKIRAKAKAVAKRFNKNLKKNWDSVLLKAFEYVLDYELSKTELDQVKIKMLSNNIELLLKEKK